MGYNGQFKLNLPKAADSAAIVSMCAQKVIQAAGPDDSKIETQGISTFKILVRLLLIDSRISLMLALYALSVFRHEMVRPITSRRKTEKPSTRAPVLQRHSAFAFLVYPM